MINRHQVRRAVAVAASGAALTAAAVAAGASHPSPAAADSTATLQFHCAFPLMGQQPVTLQIGTSLPTSIAAGASTGQVNVTAVATIDSATAGGLRTVGAASLDGTALTSESLVSPSGSALPLKVPAKVATTQIPSSGPVQVDASATIAPLTFPTAGTWTVTIDSMLLTVTPHDAGGRTTGLDTFDSDCTLDPGQGGVVATVQATGSTADTTPPTAPGALTASGTTSTATNLSWTGSTDNVGVTGYDVLRDGTPVATVTGTSTTVSGLSPATSYSFTVKAHDAAGNVSPASSAVQVTTPPSQPSTVSYTYGLQGTTHLAAPGSDAHLSGTVAATLTTGTGAFTATLGLSPTTTSFKLYGFLPVTASVTFATVGSTTGQLSPTGLTSTSQVLVRLPSITLFGFPVGGGASCQTTTPAQIPLRSGAGFDPVKGGALTGSYSLPSFANCGYATAALNMVAPGPGNTVDVTLTPTAPTS
ncbi:DUF6801 domain-containing protein [Nocardioides ultimimeridianus]